MNYSDILNTLKDAGNFRVTPPDSSSGHVVDLSSNDYLGIALDDGLRQEFLSRNGHLAFTSSASRLLAAAQEEYSLLEQCLSALYGGKAALLFNSGYHANSGLIPALAAGRTLIVADRLVHASIIDGIILSRCPFERFPHNDYEALRRILRRRGEGFERIIVVTESVFSMDGDSSDIGELASVKREFPATMLYIDEAHAFGVCGPSGLGLVEASGHASEVDVVVGTFGKAAASMGAFCVMSHELRDIAVNRARSLIFSTALPPINVAWTRFVVERIAGMEASRERLRRLSRMLHDALSPLSAAKIACSHIQPLVVGDARRAVMLSRKLLAEGFKVLPIRTPTVPPGTERLRFSLSCGVGEESLTHLAEVLKSLCL